MFVFRKAHPVQQAMSRAATPADLNEAGFRRNPGEPGASEAASGEYSKPRIQWQGLTIAIENPAGSVRRGRNRAGVTWEVRMRFDYGEVLNTLGVDGDPVDVIMGPNLDAPMVYVVHQRRYNDWANYDEDKCCIGFDSQSDAEQAFLSNYNDPRFLGPVTAMPVDEFVAKVRATKNAPAMIKAIAPVVLFFKAHVGAYLRGGKMVNLQGYQGRTARAVAAPGQLSLFGSNKPLPPSPLAGKHPVHDTGDLFDADEHGEMPPARRATREDDAEPNHDHLLADIPGATFKRGKGLISGHYGVEVGGEVVGNYHAKPEDAVAAARQVMASREQGKKEKADHDAEVGKLRERLLSGGEPTDRDLSLLGLRPGSAGLEWFIPAAAKVFGITSHAVRPHIKDMITIGHTDMGVKKEFVAPKKGLQAISAGLNPAPTADDDHPAPMPRSLLSMVPDDRRDEWKDLHRRQHELHHYELGQVREKMDRLRSKRNKAESALREAESAVTSLRGAPVPDPAREASAQKMVDQHHAEFTKLTREQEGLVGQHQSLYEKIAKLGRDKEKIAAATGDMDMDWAAMRKRTTAEQQEHEKSMLKRYRDHYKAKDAERKRKPETMTKSIVFLRPVS